MTSSKRPSATLSGIKDATDRERPAQEFRPCSTCRYAFVAEPDGMPACRMFGNVPRGEARFVMCGRHGDAWRAKEPSDFAAVPMVDRVLG